MAAATDLVLYSCDVDDDYGRYCMIVACLVGGPTVSELAKVAAAAAPVPEGDFQAAEVFDGSRAGFAFRAGPNGVGFYKDQ